MNMHASRLDSPRLKKVADLLRTRQKFSTRDIVRMLDVCAVNSIVSELRARGMEIACERIRHPVTGVTIFLYQMTADAPAGDSCAASRPNGPRKGGRAVSPAGAASYMPRGGER